jgi:6-pyruvoyltetrahydropterin/6-carboxytetrahydropterin synthase
MIATIFNDFTFDSAHFLPRVPDGHKCKQMHGHTYHLRVYVRGTVDAVTGWVVDYAAVKAIVQDVALRHLDHKTINDTIENPTAENIAAWILKKLRESNLHNRPYIEVTGLELRETDSAGVVVP